MQQAQPVPIVSEQLTVLPAEEEKLLRNLKNRCPGSQLAAKRRWHLNNGEITDLILMGQKDMEAARKFVSKIR